MLNKLVRILAVAVLVGSVIQVFAAERWQTLQAIHMIENPNNSTRPGSCGELGAYQFRRSTWRMHTRQPFQSALSRAQSDAVAVAHYEWIKRNLEESGLPATTYNIALAWNAGIGATTSGRVPRASRSYAERVVNLSRDLRRSEVAFSGPMERIVITH